VLDGVEVRTKALVVRELRDGDAVRFRARSQANERRIVAWVLRIRSAVEWGGGAVKPGTLLDGKPSADRRTLNASDCNSPA
jgi:hypothetical protein